MNYFNNKSPRFIAGVQRRLAICGGLYDQKIDGLVGPATIEASEQFIDNYHCDNDFIKVLQDTAMQMQPTRIASKEDFIFELKIMARHFGLDLPEQLAYILATVEHETAGLFKPVREGLDNEPYRARLRYKPFYGRGYVQLTWQSNYKKYSEILGINLVKNPDFALDPAISLFILLHGFKTGSFRKNQWLERYINSDGFDFMSARLCINGRKKGQSHADKAERIAHYANNWLKVLKDNNNE